MQSPQKFKNALISVSDKSGLIDFVKPLSEAGMRIVSTGGTAKHLRDAGLNVVDISQQTEFPEILDGRVKTLHPKVHMALLARQDLAAHRDILKSFDVDAFDLVICNLYPFEETARKGVKGEELIEQIDIGGPSMLRSAAKNFQTVTVVCDPMDYLRVLNESKSLELRQELATKVFRHTSYYDAMIAQKLFEENSSETQAQELRIPERALSFKLKQELRYGENPHQKAGWYVEPLAKVGLHYADILQGKELSYNNLLDLDAALQLCLQFQSPATIAVKHNNPCGVALDQSPVLALEKCLKADPVSVFGGVVAFNRAVGKSEAELLGVIFLECIVAPDFTKEALEILGKKKNLRLMRMDFPSGIATQNLQLKSIFGGYLLQESDQNYFTTSDWNFHGLPIDKPILEDMKFGEVVCGFLKSNAIAIVRQGQTLGLGMGQVNRVDAVEQAILRMRTHHGESTGAVLISDAFFPFPDSVDLIAKAGIEYVLQPGGSVKDEEVLAAAKKANIKMIFTGRRHFKH